MQINLIKKRDNPRLFVQSVWKNIDSIRESQNIPKGDIVSDYKGRFNKDFTVSTLFKHSEALGVAPSELVDTDFDIEEDKNYSYRIVAKDSGININELKKAIDLFKLYKQNI